MPTWSSFSSSFWSSRGASTTRVPPEKTSHHLRSCSIGRSDGFSCMFRAESTPMHPSSAQMSHLKRLLTVLGIYPKQRPGPRINPTASRNGWWDRYERPPLSDSNRDLGRRRRFSYSAKAVPAVPADFPRRRSSPPGGRISGGACRGSRTEFEGLWN